MDPLTSLEGWLTQEKTQGEQTEQLRYCIIVNQILSVYKDKDSLDEPEDLISLNDITDVNPLCTPSPLPSFQISLLNRPPLFFQCLSISDCERWMCALRTFRSVDRVSLEDFEVLALIGAGGYGKVYQVRKKSSGEIFAMKSISKNRIKPRKESKIMIERNILLLANHQFLTRLYYSFQSPQKYFFIIDYCAGGDLNYLLTKDEISLSSYQIKLYLAEIIVAIRAIHHFGIIYRDLKPANVLLDQDGHIKLADFGLVKIIDNKASNNTLCGTHEYLAPEIVKEEAQTFSIDYWCLGVLAFRLIFSYMPFSNQNLQILYKQIVGSNPRFPSRMVGTPEESLIQGLLKKDPAERLGSVGNDITKHVYFEGIEWDKVAKKQYEPEFKPCVSLDDSLDNFDLIYTSQNPQKSFNKMISTDKKDGDDENRRGNVIIRNFSVNNEGSLSETPYRTFI